jgi:ABC-type lipoprotein export system ATPase subunit
MSNNLSYPKSGRVETDSLAAVIHVENVWKSFDNEKIRVLKDVSFSVQRGKVCALWGASGSGKSTLLHLLGGLDTADRGNIVVDGMNPGSEKHRLRLRREKVGFIFQMHNLLPGMTMRENCWIPALATSMPKAEANRRFEELTDWLDLGHRRDRRIRDLSGGERQRTAICRALMHRPTVLLADEPTGSLDEKNGEQVFNLLYDLAGREKVTVIMATHERHFAQRCDHHILVRDGQVELID